MPDMQTELSKVLSEWDSPEPSINQPKEKRMFPQPNNVSHDTYNYIHANPGLTTAQITAAMAAKGFKTSSVSSLVYQMHLVGRVRKEGHRVFSIEPTLRPIKARELREARKINATAHRPKPKKAAPVEKQSAGIAALHPQATQSKQPAPAKAERITVDLDEWINEVPLMQARMVYMKLKAIFEGGAQ